MNFFSKTGAIALVAGLGFASGANALTLTFDTSANGVGVDYTIIDNVLNDSDPGIGSIAAFGGGFGGSLGGFSLVNVTAAAADMMNASELTQTSLDVSGGASGETLTVITSASFSGAAAAPLPSGVVYSLGGSELGGTVSGFGTAGGTSTSTLSFDPGALGHGSFSGDAFATATLSDPFDLVSTVTLGQVAVNKTTSFTSTVSAAVPLPAAGWMLIAGIGGLAAMRRRKKA